MPWPVYTETFIRSNLVGQWVSYQVPPGKRAVVKSIQFVNYGGSACSVVCQIGGVLLVAHDFPASKVAYIEAVTAVAYSGMYLDTLANVGQVHTTVSGYLFNDVSLRFGGPPENEVGRLPAAGPLPATDLERQLALEGS